jgi:hypothetical protein
MANNREKPPLESWKSRVLTDEYTERRQHTNPGARTAIFSVSYVSSLGFFSLEVFKEIVIAAAVLLPSSSSPVRTFGCPSHLF